MSTKMYHWVEDDYQFVVFVGNKSESEHYYKNNGGSRHGLHLISASDHGYNENKEVKLPAPVVGKVWNP